MNAYIAYSIEEEERFIIPLLSASLNEKGVYTQSRENELLEPIDRSLIDDVDIFIGIITDQTFFDKIIKAYEYAVSKSISSILFLDDRVTVSDDAPFAIQFSRTMPGKAFENLFTYRNVRIQGDDLKTNLAFFMGGVILETLTQILGSSNVKSFRPQLNSVHIVESRLLQLGPSRFQELCDIFLAARFPELKYFNRVGSQLGSQKTTIGTPDTLIELANGKYVLIEITTQQQGLKKKIIDDIDKVANEQKTGIPLTKVWKLIVCSNSPISIADKDEIQQHAERNNILNVEILDLPALSAQLYLHHQRLAQDYLELAIDSGQVVSLDNFIKTYESSGSNIATPLNNPFYHRSEELQELIDSITSNKLILISGAPGVGKTKLAIEAIRAFGKRYPSYATHAIINKDADVLEDMYSHFKRGSSNILFIDDVNRFGRINSVIGFLKSSFDVNLKIVLTTRDYGLSYMQNILADMQYYSMRVDKLKDEEVLDIIKSQPFGIVNSTYSDKILSIADGNARLAIMAAKLALDTQKFEALTDVSDLLENYFTTFARDEKLFQDKNLLRCIGIISFFYTFPYSNENILTETCNNFKLTRTQFVDAIDRLEDLEFLDLHFDHAKISDQTLATFYFYKVFIKDKIYSFYDLLVFYFRNNPEKFKDSVYPVVSSFGFNEVRGLILGDLKNYLRKAFAESEDLGFNFLKVFHFYLHEDCLHVVHEKSRSLPNAQSSYQLDYHALKSNYSTKDQYLDLLDNFYQTDSLLQETLEVSFEYVRKRPDSLKELLKNIVQELTFDKDDHYHRYNRQRLLFELFANKIEKNEELYILSFLAIAHEFLEFEFRKSKSARGHKISIYSFPFQLTAEATTIRQKIWNLLESLYDTYPNEVLTVFEKHGSIKPTVHTNVMEFDLMFIVPFIETKLSPENFRHALYVQEFLYWIKRKGISLKDANLIRTKFYNNHYKWYSKLSWDRFKGKEEFEFRDWNEFQKLKEDDIRKFTFFTNENEFIEFIDFFILITELRKTDHYQLNNSIDIVLEQALQSDPLNAFRYFLIAARQQNKLKASLGRTTAFIARSKELQQRFWQNFSEGALNEYLALNFLSQLPSEDVTNTFLLGFYNILKNITSDIYLFPDHYKNFELIDSNFYGNLGSISIDKNNAGPAKIRIDDRYFELFADRVPVEVLKDSYLQQDKLQDHFDYNADSLFAVVAKSPGFLIEYFKYILEDPHNHSYHSDRKIFNKVWEFVDYESMLDMSFDLLANENLYLVAENFANSFFKNISPEKHPLRDGYIFRFIEMNSENPKKIDLIFDVIHHSAGEIFNTAFTKYLKLNPRVQDFSEINWVDKQMVYSGDVIIGEIKAAKWRNLLQIVEDANLGLNGIFIMKYIKDQIDSENRYANWERERKFLSRR